MVGAVDQLTLTSTTGKPATTPEPSTLFEALFDARDVFLRHRAADDLRFELEALAGLVRLDDELDPRELTGTAGLLLVSVIDFRALGDPLAERHLRRADVGIDLVGALTGCRP